MPIDFGGDREEGEVEGVSGGSVRPRHVQSGSPELVHDHRVEQTNPHTAPLKIQGHKDRR